MAKPILALALVDLIAHGVKAGQILEADASIINPLVKDGQLDPHKDAVAYAKSDGRPVVRSAIEVAAELTAAIRDTALVDIAKLEDLLTKATDDETKAALGKELTAKREALAALG